MKMRGMIYSMTLKGRISNLTSGQSHELTQMGHAAYQSIRLDGLNTVVIFSGIYLVSSKNYQPKWMVTFGDVI